MRLAKRTALGAVLAAILIYAADYLVARSRGAAALDTVQVQPYYAVPLKDGKTEFIMLDPEKRACIRSLFPHFGYPPCWYLNRQKQQRVNM